LKTIDIKVLRKMANVAIAKQHTTNVARYMRNFQEAIEIAKASRNYEGSAKIKYIQLA